MYYFIYDLTHACHRNLLRHFRFKPYEFGVTTINRKIPNAFNGNHQKMMTHHSVMTSSLRIKI